MPNQKLRIEIEFDPEGIDVRVVANPALPVNSSEFTGAQTQSVLLSALIRQTVEIFGLESYSDVKKRLSKESS